MKNSTNNARELKHEVAQVLKLVRETYLPVIDGAERIHKIYASSLAANSGGVGEVIMSDDEIASEANNLYGYALNTNDKEFRNHVEARMFAFTRGAKFYREWLCSRAKQHGEGNKNEMI